MLGMMNCPTDTVDFYAASPSQRTIHAGKDADVKVFTEVKDRPQVTYTEGGRKLVDGKLSQESQPEDPQLMWNRLILGTVVKGQIKNDLRIKASVNPIARAPSSKSIPVSGAQLTPPPLQRQHSKSWSGRPSELPK